MKIVDRNGTLVSSRTPITLDSSIGKIELTDLDPKQPGIQVFVEGGTLVVPIQRQLRQVKEHCRLKAVFSIAVPQYVSYLIYVRSSQLVW